MYSPGVSGHWNMVGFEIQKGSTGGFLLRLLLYLFFIASFELAGAGSFL